MIEVNVNFVLFEELEEKSNGNGVETRVVIIRQSGDTDAGFEHGATDSRYFPE